MITSCAHSIGINHGQNWEGALLAYSGAFFGAEVVSVFRFNQKWIIPVLSWFKFWKLNIVIKMLLLNICCSVTLYNNQIQYLKQYTQDLSLVVFINTRHYIHRFLLKFLKLSRIRPVKCSSYWLYHCYCCCSNECIRNETFD